MSDNNSAELWERARTICLATLSSEDERSNAERYFSMISSVVLEGNVFIIKTNTPYASDLIKEHYEKHISKSLILAGCAKELSVVFQVDPTSKPEIVVPAKTKQTALQTKSTVSGFISTMPLDPNFTFEEFVRGPSNSLANATAISVAEKPGKGYNPLFIYGGTGLGKTHLMQAIGNEILKRDPSISVCYLTAETFLNEFVNNLKNDTIQQFRDRYRSVDVLLVDDIQFIAQRKHFQEEFFNTYNALFSADKQIVMTSDVPPKKLMNFEERLISRFQGGMVQEIELPSYETRLAILRKKSESITPRIQDNALKFIAENIKSHVRAMEGALAKVQMMLKINSTLILSDDILYHLLSDFIEKEKSLKKITIDEIQNAVCKKYSVTMADLLSPERTQSIVTPRQLAMYISRKYTPKSLPEIAKSFDRTNATILHGVRTIEQRIQVEKDLKDTLDEIVTQFGYSLVDTVE